MYNAHAAIEKRVVKNTRALVKDAPDYVRRFAKWMERYKPATRYAYLFSIVQYMEYVRSEDPSLRDVPLEKMPVRIFDGLTHEKLDAYLKEKKVADRARRSEKDIAPLYQNRILAAFRAFYLYLNTAERLPYECPVPKAKRKKVVRKTDTPLSRSDIERLIGGVRKNDLYLLSSVREDGSTSDELIPIPGEIAMKRQRNIKRNVAILLLLTIEGLSTAEIAGLDTGSILWDPHILLVAGKRGETEAVPLSGETLAALRSYLSAPGIPEDILSRQKDRAAFMEFCKRHMTDPNAPAKAARVFKSHDQDFLLDVERCCTLLREGGRDSYFPTEYTAPLFLSNRSKRISVRMIEQMASDMRKTYLPERAKG